MKEKDERGPIPPTTIVYNGQESRKENKQDTN